ncbi:hypothetical protein AB0A73_01890 [Glycomyces sp. NPDC047369]
MTDTDPPPPTHTSADGGVTVVDGNGTPVVRLTAEALRLPARELAELVTWTAREAADAVRAAEAHESRSAADALAELKNLRDGLRQDGLQAVIDRKRAEYGADQDDLPPEDPRSMARMGLADHIPTEGLDAAIRILERFQPRPGQPTELVPVTGRAAGPDDAVTVESTGEYPIAGVLLGIHARELGPEALGKEITETAARAIADLKERQRTQIDGLDLPLTMDQVDGLPGEMDAYGDKVRGQYEYLRRQHDDIIRRLHGK